MHPEVQQRLLSKGSTRLRHNLCHKSNLFLFCTITIQLHTLMNTSLGDWLLDHRDQKPRERMFGQQLPPPLSLFSADCQPITTQLIYCTLESNISKNRPQKIMKKIEHRVFAHTNFLYYNHFL